jgi:hypothetical protein
MKTAIAAGIALSAIALSGCSTTATVAPASVSTSVSSVVTIGYDTLCKGSASSPSLLASIQLLPLNAQRQADIASLQTICNNGSPTNAITVTIDGLSVYAMLQRDFPQLGLK